MPPTVTHLRLAHSGGCLCWLLMLAGMVAYCAGRPPLAWVGYATTMIAMFLAVAYVFLYSRLYRKMPAEFRKEVEDRERRWRGE